MEDGVAHLRTLGKVNSLEERMIQEKPRGKVGIAHTRWATHGEPSESNAHPHASKNRVFIVHNGIIENYLDLKNALTEKGYVFQSQTDSELIAHLIDSFLNNGKNMIESMQFLKANLKGAYAIAAIDQEDSNNFYLARNKSPLLLGLGEKEHFAASDPLAIGELTNQFIFLEYEVRRV